MTFQCYLLTMQEEVGGNRVHQQLWEWQWEGHELNVIKFESCQPPGCQVWIMAHQISFRTSLQLFGTQLKLMSLCADKRRGRLTHRCSSCITASHGWMIILPIKSGAGQQSSCTRFLNESSSSLAESLMPEQLLCQSDEASRTYFSELRFCCCTNN